ncbi:CHAT domain-containing protein [Candidatus Amarolinea aalborgensis]|jgi:hypothetical protein|uniref:CHAT domain-containing protein n=1 Tax=Candidatus Amarolinea aalborgensis TaxID=2249329 RepID=UPI003BF9861D
MTPKAYADFDLLIEEGNESTYRARVINSPTGQAMTDFTLPFAPLELDNFVLRLGQARRRTRHVQSPDMALIESFGNRLFRAVFAGDVGTCLRSSLATVQRQEQGLRVRLRLSESPSLIDIPWEYLFDNLTNRFLALSVDTPIVRYLDLPGAITPLMVRPPLSALVMIASPSDLSPLDAEQEWAKLKEAVSDLEQRGLMKMDRLETCTLPTMQQRLRQRTYHIFHFIGHGGFDPATGGGVLLMNDETGHSQAVDAFRLGTLLHDHKSLRLAVLNACEGGRASRSDPFGGVGQSLLQQGIPAVIAMQFEVTDKTAIVLTHSFYQALADGYPVDAALGEARKSIFISNDLEWGTPVLYLRAPDGRIFDVVSAAAPDPLSPRIANLMHLAEAAFAAHDWNATLSHLQQLLALDPTHAGAQALTQRVQQAQAVVAPLAVPNTQLGTAQMPPVQSAAQVRQPARSRPWARLGLALALVALIGGIGWRFLPWGGIGRASISTASNITATSAVATLTAPTPTTALAMPTANTVVPVTGVESTPTQPTGPNPTATAVTTLESPSTATATRLPPPSATASSPPTATDIVIPIAEPTARVDRTCPNAPPPHVQVGDTALVSTARDPLSLRTQPGIRSSKITSLSPNTRLRVIGGPACEDRTWWWQVRWEDGKTVGWVQDGRDEKDPNYLCRVDSPSSSQPAFGVVSFCDAAHFDTQLQLCMTSSAALPSGITRFYITIPFRGLPKDSRLDRIWYVNGQLQTELERKNQTWNANQTCDEGVEYTWIERTFRAGDEYRLDIYRSGESQPRYSASVRISASR